MSGISVGGGGVGDALESTSQSIYTRIGAPSAASIAADIANISAAGSGDPNVPTADSATNLKMSQVIGNKSDTLIGTPSATTSVVAYSKGTLNELNHTTHGLNAIHVEVAKAATALTSATWIDAKAGYLSGSVALEATVAKLADVGAIEGATTLHNKITAVRAALLDQITAARLAELDAANLPADIDTLKASHARQLFTMDFWSAVTTGLTIPSSASSQALTDVVVASLPSGATIVKAMPMFKFGAVYNSSSTTTGYTSGAQHIQIQKGTAGGYADAISLGGSLFGISALGTWGGDVFIGDHDVVAKVDANATYKFQWTSALATPSALAIMDYQTGLRIWYSV